MNKYRVVVALEIESEERITKETVKDKVPAGAEVISINRIPPTEEFHVDLKWSPWSAHKDHWDDHAPGVWEKAEKALDNLAEVTIYTAPRKEIRFGRVVINTDAAGEYVAEVHFMEEWDDEGTLAGTMGIDGEEFEELRLEFQEDLPRHEQGVGVDRCEEVHAETFEELMKKIDEVEGRLLEDSKEVWKEIEFKYDQNEIKKRKIIEIEIPACWKKLIDVEFPWDLAGIKDAKERVFVDDYTPCYDDVREVTVEKDGLVVSLYLSSGQANYYGCVKVRSGTKFWESVPFHDFEGPVECPEFNCEIRFNVKE